MRELLAGNARFVEGKPANKELGDARRRALALGQHPKAAILSCSDSRVPPEHLFDQGLGDLFVIRLAGNVPEPAAVGSVEYAVEHLGVGLVVVLGHHACGAVKAALEGGEPEGDVGLIVKDIAPAVRTARATGKAGAALEDAVVHENARRAAAALTERSAAVRRLVREGKLEIKVAVYDLATGQLELE
jgi:carbonic anhydrase